MPAQQLPDRVRELRAAGRTPKEIARALKMPPSAVAPLIRSLAAAEGRPREDALIGCWISPGWSSSVQAPERPDWPGSAPSERTGHSGLVTVLVARDRGGSTAGMCFYLVDTWCLGLKNAAGPQSMDRRRLGGFIQQIFSAWDEPAVQVPLELGRQIVYGAIGYARELGFEPHADFGRAAGYLGAWDGECELTFGRETDVHLRPGRRRGEDHPQAAPRPRRRELRLRAHDLRLTAGGREWRCRSRLTSDRVRTHRFAIAPATAKVMTPSLTLLRGGQA
jgi:hypothetical protein